MALKRRALNLKLWILAAIPVLSALWVWLSPLAFVPVPWPDDSAFYFVAKDLFQWPPRWVMLPQAPFEPTYRIWNFNTMPLYPILIGLGRFVGIDGSFALKFWPLAFWAASGSLLAVWIARAGLPVLIAAVLALAIGMDPILRWASVLVRPESLIGLCGVALVLGLSLGFPKRFEPRKWWDPVAALLAIAAYAHFNAIHLLFPVVAALAAKPRRLVSLGWKTALYLVPWLFTIAWHPGLFIHQMRTQWTRLAVPNGWLGSVHSAIDALFHSLGSPEPWPRVLLWAVGTFAVLALVGLLYGPVRDLLLRKILPRPEIPLLPASAWVFGAAWLWDSKPEVWFIYYIHLAVWSFVGLAALAAWKERTVFSRLALATIGILTIWTTGVFTIVNVTQASSLGKDQTWNWETYHEFVDCVDDRLKRLEAELGSVRPFRVWCPTFPDITVELSRKHPDWEFTRTNDFSERVGLALAHGREAEAVVVTETLNWTKRTVSGPWSEHPEISSTWMNWKGYFLNQFWTEAGWKPNRYVCQRGRWQAFLFMKTTDLPK